jgi:hypothetical protein
MVIMTKFTARLTIKAIINLILMYILYSFKNILIIIKGKGSVIKEFNNIFLVVGACN